MSREPNPARVELNTALTVMQTTRAQLEFESLMNFSFVRVRRFLFGKTMQKI